MTDGGDPTPRWRQRFENFERALGRLTDGVERVRLTPEDDLLQAGVIQHFEFTWELAWKVLADYLAASDVPLAAATPREVVREAFKAGLIEDGQLWMTMNKDRNRSSHIYSGAMILEIGERIAADYQPLLQALRSKLLSLDEGVDL